MAIMKSLQQGFKALGSSYCSDSKELADEA
jgi:hypothetical protein